MFRKIGILLRLFERRSLFYWGIFFTVLLSVIAIIFSVIMKSMMDSALTGDYSIFYIALYAFIGLLFFDMLFSFLRNKLLGTFAENGMRIIRDRVGKKLTSLPLSVFSEGNTGDYLTRATNDVAKIKNFTTVSFPQLISQPLSAILAITYLFFLSWKLALLSVFIIPIIIMISVLFSKPISSISSKMQKNLGKVNSIFIDYIKGVEVAKSYNLEDELGDKFNNNVTDNVNSGKKLAFKEAFLSSLSQVSSMMPFFITFAVGGYFVYRNEMTSGGLLAFINLLNFVTFPLSYIPVIIGDASRDLVGFERVNELLNQDEERFDGESFAILTEPYIEFRHVSFAFPGHDYLFSDLNFTVNKNERVAFVGSSGSGKSTIIKLLLGYYPSYEGEIIILGHELKSWNLSSLRKHLAYVSQSANLFPETIKENIGYGKEGASEEEIRAVSLLAYVDEFVSKYPSLYDTMIGELGNTLSGGQKQRITIARAILKDAPILLLDEATSALDNESEVLIERSLNDFLSDRTSITIAHRLSTIKNADKIMVLSSGKIVEVGNHEELLIQNGLYYELWNKQFSSVEEGSNDEE